MSSDPKQSGAPRSASPADDALERELAPWLRDSDVQSPDLSDMFGKLEQQLSDERGPRAWLRSRSTPLRLAIALLALLAPAAVTWAASLRPDIALYPFGRMIAIAAFLVASLATAAWIALRPLQRPALSDAITLGTIVVSVVGLLGLYALPVAHEAHPASLQMPGTTVLFARAWPCMWVGLSIGAAVLALLVALDRGGLRRALVLATASGLCANLVLQFHCPNTARSHVVLAHFGVLLLLLFGAALSARMTNHRAADRD